MNFCNFFLHESFHVFLPKWQMSSLTIYMLYYVLLYQRDILTTQITPLECLNTYMECNSLFQYFILLFCLKKCCCFLHSPDINLRHRLLSESIQYIYFFFSFQKLILSCFMTHLQREDMNSDRQITVDVGLRHRRTNNTHLHTYSMAFTPISVTIYEIHWPGFRYSEAGVQGTCPKWRAMTSKRLSCLWERSFFQYNPPSLRVTGSVNETYECNCVNVSFSRCIRFPTHYLLRNCRLTKGWDWKATMRSDTK